MSGNVWKKIRWSLAMRGISGTLKAAVRKLGPQPARGPHAFDREYGVETSGLIGGADLAAGHAHDVHITAYAGIPPSRFNETIRRWLRTPPAKPAESYTFVDLGCGKGRAAMLASKLQFREVIGVELSPKLAEIAEANVAIWQAGNHAAIPLRIVCGDATEFELPPGPCLIYLANPFGAPVLRRLLEKLVARAQAGGDVVELLYQTPEQEAVFAENPAFQLLWSEVIPTSAADMADENVYSVTDRCNAYRLRPLSA